MQIARNTGTRSRRRWGIAPPYTRTVVPAGASEHRHLGLLQQQRITGRIASGFKNHGRSALTRAVEVQNASTNINRLSNSGRPFLRRVKLRYAINPQVICCDTQDEAERLADEAERNAGPRDRMVNALGAGLVGTPQLIASRLRRYQEAVIAFNDVIKKLPDDTTAIANLGKLVGFLLLALLNILVLRLGGAKMALVRAWRSCGCSL